MIYKTNQRSSNQFFIRGDGTPGDESLHGLMAPVGLKYCNADVSEGTCDHVYGFVTGQKSELSQYALVKKVMHKITWCN